MTTATPVHCGFTVLVDSGESQPWTFQGLKADADRGHAPLSVPISWRSLGRFPNSRGDYSIAGLMGKVGIERKSMEDCISTVLGWQTGYESQREIEGRRDKFKCELANLAAMEAGVVIVEASFKQCRHSVPGCDGENYFNPLTGEINPTRGKKTCAENAKIFFRSVVSWQQRFKGCNWFFCDDRRDAEKVAFRYLEKYVEHRMEEMDRDERKAFRRELLQA